MRFTVWKEPEDTARFGHHQNLVCALVIFIIFNICSFAIFTEGYAPITAMILFCVMIPGSACISGIINGFYLMRREFNQASKTNFIIAGVSFIVGSTCTGLLFLT